MEIEQLQQYDEWLADHLDELVQQYANKVVAIHQGQVIIVGELESEVYSQIRKQDLTPMPLVFRVPSEDDLQSILKSKCIGNWLVLRKLIMAFIGWVLSFGLMMWPFYKNGLRWKMNI